MPPVRHLEAWRIAPQDGRSSLLVGLLGCLFGLFVCSIVCLVGWFVGWLLVRLSVCLIGFLSVCFCLSLRFYSSVSCLFYVCEHMHGRIFKYVSCICMSVCVCVFVRFCVGASVRVHERVYVCVLILMHSCTVDCLFHHLLPCKRLCVFMYAQSDSDVRTSPHTQPCLSCS